MRKVVLPVVAICLLLPSFALAQAPAEPTPGAPAATTAPAGENHVLPVPSSTVGLNKIARDGVSTVTVPAVPCSPFARETDGSTTCVGIPGPIDRPRGTVGTAR